MKKKLHPIRKIQDAFDKVWYRCNKRLVDPLPLEAQVLARSVKPLLDALEAAAFFQPKKQREESWRLVAEWRRPLK